MLEKVDLEAKEKKDNITKEVQDADTQKRFKEIEKIIISAKLTFVFLTDLIKKNKKNK